ncbi:hypothetical protein [uncultured Ornithinimicrobium sp.]|uniref:hypothetical protein n=1 Tax=uncultured Ornithinimicrobium sp. TaxID=259307 RepID=UPI002592035F|nr:hypothetical protein [uncultured Ornithinimicrobium sp.]
MMLGAVTVLHPDGGSVPPPAVVALGRIARPHDVVLGDQPEPDGWVGDRFRTRGP